MPITSMRIENFKCFKDSSPFKLAPLTVLVGRNSSGKSSVIQPFLLLKQTLETRGFANTINLKGPFYDAGSFPDIAYQHRIDAPIILGFRSSVVVPDEVAVVGGVPVGSMRRSTDTSVSLTIETSDPYGPQVTQIKVEAGGRPPVDLVYVPPVKSSQDAAPVEWALKDRQLHNGAAIGRLGSMFPFIAHMRGSDWSQLAENVIDYNIALAHVEEVLRNLTAIGPFRTPPERRYEFAGKAFADVGLSGHATVDTLIADEISKRGTIQAISDWFAKSGLAKSMSLVPLGEPGAYQVRFKIGETDANYADVGFGFSQVLPVLVQGLRARSHTMFICQQPELHLHPDAQVALADFFISLAIARKQVIVETHSEHLILGIRRRLAQERASGKPQITPDDVSLLYVDDSDPHGSTVRQLELDEGMNIVNWPKGFMDEAIEERLKIMELAPQLQTSPDDQE